MELIEIDGFYGGMSKTPCTIFVADMGDGSSWYCVNGSLNVNRTYDVIDCHTWVEQLDDFDHFNWKEPIESLEDLQTAIEA